MIFGLWFMDRYFLISLIAVTGAVVFHLEFNTSSWCMHVVVWICSPFFYYCVMPPLALFQQHSIYVVPDDCICWVHKNTRLNHLHQTEWRTPRLNCVYQTACHVTLWLKPDVCQTLFKWLEATGQEQRERVKVSESMSCSGTLLTIPWRRRKHLSALIFTVFLPFILL